MKFNELSPEQKKEVRRSAMELAIWYLRNHDFSLDNELSQEARLELANTMEVVLNRDSNYARNKLAEM